MFEALWASIAIVLFGKLADKIGRLRQLRWTSIAFIIVVYFLFHLPQAHKLYTVILFIFIYETFKTLLAACYFTTLTELFPTRIRYTGYAFSYGCIYAIAGLFPSLFTVFMKQDYAINYFVLFFIGIGLLTIIGTFMFRDLTGKKLEH
jgi:MHS family proline/betaine transporter-like MFS transporter